MRATRASAFAAALLTPGCAEVLDLDRFQHAESGPGSTGSDGTCVCTEPAPAGWSGPGLLFLEAAEAPACPASWPLQAVSGGTNPSGAKASCFPCACDAATGVCGNAVLQSYSATSCVGSFTPFATNLSCSGAPSSMVSVKGTMPLKQLSGSCQPLGGGVQSATPAIFEENALLCEGATATAGCGADALCVPPPSAPFLQQLCIWRAGDVACESPYLERTVIHDRFTDTRSCSPCACGVPSEITIQCTGHFALYDDGTCSTNVANTPADGLTCTDVVGVGSALYVTDSETGICPPIGGDPIGEVTPENPTTICCHDM